MTTATPSSSRVTMEGGNGHREKEPSHITSLIASAHDKPFFSLEFFPPKTEQGLANLYSRMARMIETVQPAWVQITWGAGGTTQRTSLDLAGRVQNGQLDAAVPLSGGQQGESSVRRNACLHLTCTNVQRDSLDETLEVSRQS
jgi:methylenetetrahydrofolate reductase (NADPH)